MRSLLILLLVSGGLQPEWILAQAPNPESEPKIREPEAVGEEAASDQDQEDQLQKQKLEIGLILTSGIVVMGVFLVVLTLLYGRRTRRQLATGRGSSAVRDELWYLKHSRESTESDNSTAESQGDSQ